jgi:hypothetical protein
MYPETNILLRSSQSSLVHVEIKHISCLTLDTQASPDANSWQRIY